MSRTRKLLLVALVLAVVAVVINVTDTNHSLKKLVQRKTRYPAMYARHFAPVKPIKPIGSADAKVHIKVFAQSGNHCHEGTIWAFQQLGEAIPNRVHIRFLDTASKEGFDAAEKAGIDCDAGVLINGKKEFEVEENGEKFTIGFHGPLGMGVPPRYLRLAVEHELAAKYPEGLTEKEKADLKEVWKKLPAVMDQGFGEGPPEMRDSHNAASGETSAVESPPEAAKKQSPQGDQHNGDKDRSRRKPAGAE